MNAIDAIKSRRSVRRYASQKVGLSNLSSLIECGNSAPSGANRRPLTYFVVTSPTKLKAISLLNPASSFLSGEGVTVIAVAADMNIARTPLEDGCAATENILIAAQAIGLGSCWVRGHGDDKQTCMEAIIGIAAPLTLVSLVAVGFPREDNLSLRERVAPRVVLVD